MSSAQNAITQLCEQVSRSVIGQDHVVRALVIGLLTDGHILLEGLPGTAKTRSIKALAEALQVDFGRIQFTPDLLPTDVTGTEVYREVDGKPSLTFQPGPVFNNLVLADEINRAPAKVQAALLEAMAEKTLTSGNQTLVLPKLFMVLATQNPIEQEGTYPLPEAQMDRFLMKVTVEYPDDAAEKAVMRLVRSEEGQVAEAIEPVDTAAILEGRAAIKEIHVGEAIEDYMVGLVMATRHGDRYPDTALASWIQVGASPRATIALDRCARANAWLKGRDYVDADDVRTVAHSVLGHRIKLSFDAIADGIDANLVVTTLLDTVAVG